MVPIIPAISTSTSSTYMFATILVSLMAVIDLNTASPLANDISPNPSTLSNSENGLQVTTHGLQSVRCEELFYLQTSPIAAVHMWLLDQLFLFGMVSLNSTRVATSLKIQSVECRPRVNDQSTIAGLFDMRSITGQFSKS